MKTKVIGTYKGVREDIDWADLPEDYAQSIVNLDPENPYGKLTLRDGSLKKYTQSFTNAISAYEYKFPTPNATRLLVNDNGTLRVYDGSSWAALTLPTGSIIMSTFTAQFFGWQDNVLITAGNQYNTYTLLYSYISRLTSEDNGLFGNAINLAATYILTKAQLINESMPFNKVKCCVYIDDYYYVCYEAGSQITKLDIDFKFVDQFWLDPNNIQEDAHIVLDADTVNEKIYASLSSTIGGDVDLYVINPVGWEIEQQYDTGGLDEITGISHDSTYLYYTTATDIFKNTLADISVNAATVGSLLTVAGCVVYGSYLYHLDATAVIRTNLRKRNISDLSLADTKAYSLSGGEELTSLIIQTTNLYIGSIGTKVRKVDTDLLNPLEYSAVDNPKYLMKLISGTGVTIRAFTYYYGTLNDFANTEDEYPGLFGLTIYDTDGSGNLVAGAYYYKLSAVDVDGIEYTLTNYIREYLGASSSIDLRIIANINRITDLYRISHFNLYRAYGAANELTPLTNYQFVKRIDTNDATWNLEALTQDVYYYNYTDNVATADLSSVTYFENSGISENTLPFHVNFKYMTWIDNQLHATNFYYNGDTFPNRIIRSPIDAPVAIQFYDYYDYGNDGYDIKGLANAYGRVFAFKENTRAIFYNGTIEHESFPGISSDTGWFKYGDTIFVQHKKGIFVLNGTQIERINDPINVSFAGITDHTDGTLFVFEDKDRLIISYPGEKSFVYNFAKKTWTTYNSNFAFKNYYRNSSNEYIGLTSTYIYKIASGLDLREADGTGGSGIAITYASGLIKMSPIDGMNVTLFQADKRLKFTAYSGSALTFTMYKYTPSAQTSIMSYAVTSPTGTYVAPKTKYFDGIFGESFTWHLSGTMSAFQFNSLSISYEDLGMIPNE